MKKIVALLLAVVCLGAATAFAAPSVTRTEPVPTVAVMDEVKIDTDDVVEEFPMSILKLTSVGQIKKLDEAAQEVFKKEYDAVKEMKDGKVLSCFYCTFKEGQEVELKEGDEFLVTFNVKGVKEGDNVVVRVNGTELAANKVEAGNGKVTVRIQEFGVFSIIVK